MSRVLRIAAREYMAFVRTVGFWLSLCLAPLGILGAAFAASLAVKATPAPHLAVVDLTGAGYDAAITRAVEGGPGHPPAAILVAPPGAPYSSAADATRRLAPFLSAHAPAPGGQPLDAAAIIRGDPGRPALDLWTRNLAEPQLASLLSQAVADKARKVRLARAGLSPEAIQALEADDPPLAQYSPKSASGRVSARDELPLFIGFGMGILLWSSVLTGAGILLNSVIEEKSSRILEVLLTSASAPEIMGGKILGAAGVTATALLVWMIAGSLALGMRDPHALARAASIVVQHGLFLYFALYFAGGYLMYATLFTTIGAFCETAREAQTLLGPMMVLLTVPLIFMGQAVGRPDAPVLHILSWIPPFTPFLMAARAASGPPLWEVAGTAAIMAGATALEMMVAGRAFRAGALTSGRFELKTFFAGLAGRGERA